MSTVEEPVLAEVVPTSSAGFGDPIGVHERAVSGLQAGRKSPALGVGEPGGPERPGLGRDGNFCVSVISTAEARVGQKPRDTRQRCLSHTSLLPVMLTSRKVPRQPATTPSDSHVPGQNDE
jgi:hypothetical protein